MLVWRASLSTQILSNEQEPAQNSLEQVPVFLETEVQYSESLFLYSYFARVFEKPTYKKE